MRLRFRFGIFTLVVGLAILFFNMRDFLAVMKEPVGFYELDPMEITTGIYVEDDLWLIMDYLGTEVTTSNNVEKESAREYILPVLSEDGDMLYVSNIMGLKVKNKEDYDLIEKVIDDSIEWWNDETGNVEIGRNAYHITGVIYGMSKDEKELMLEYAMEVFGDSQNQAMNRVFPYVLIPDTRMEELLTMAAGAGIFLLGVVLLIWEFKSRR